jgi:AraC-like DNA-binding protein
MILLDQSGAAAKESRLFAPSRQQAPFVEHFWVQQNLSVSIGPSWRVIPEANPNLIFVVSRDSGGIRTRCCLVGPRSRFADVLMENRILTCGVRLRPGALPLLTRLPASSFTDRSVHVEDLFGARGRSLMDKLNYFRSPTQAVSILADFLSRELAGYDCVLPLSRVRCNRVEEMAAQSGMALRTLHSRLMHHVGLSPKRLLRIERLQRVLINSQNRFVPWVQLAVSCGFADQAHMIRDFQELLGESPTAWSSRSVLPICSRQRRTSHRNVAEEV